MRLLFIPLAALIGCGSPATSPDLSQTSGCHPLGEPFPAPSGVTDHWQVYEDRSSEQLCCTPGAKVVVAERFANDDCQDPSPLELVCVAETGDNACGPGENPCNSPLDCPLPEGRYRCCGEADHCTLLKGHQCCPGLVDIHFGFLSQTIGSCVEVPYPDAILCVSNCGDGTCGRGENQCNCPADCP